MKVVYGQVIVFKDERVMFKTEPMNPHECQNAYEELSDKFRLKMYGVKILKKTIYQGYSSLENLKKKGGTYDY